MIEAMLMAGSAMKIKSIIRHTLTSSDPTTATYTLPHSVDPDRCLVLVNNPDLGTGSTTRYSFVCSNLTAEEITFSRPSSSGAISISFQIIEFAAGVNVHRTYFPRTAFSDPYFVPFAAIVDPAKCFYVISQANAATVAPGADSYKGLTADIVQVGGQYGVQIAYALTTNFTSSLLVQVVETD